MHPEWELGIFTYNSPLTIKLKYDTEYHKLCVSARWDADYIKLTPKEVMKKYEGCVKFAGVLDPNRPEEAVEMVPDLDKIADVSQLMSVLTFVTNKKERRN